MTLIWLAYFAFGWLVFIKLMVEVVGVENRLTHIRLAYGNENPFLWHLQILLAGSMFALLWLPFIIMSTVATWWMESYNSVSGADK